MADTQIAPLGTVTAPADYTIPNAQEITLAAMFAHFDGSAAGTSWVPTLQIISDSGHTILEVPQDASVAAGSSVEASWAPFLRRATAAASGGVSGAMYEAGFFTAGLPTASLATGANGSFSNIGGFVTSGWEHRRASRHRGR